MFVAVVVQLQQIRKEVDGFKKHYENEISALREENETLQRYVRIAVGGDDSGLSRPGSGFPKARPHYDFDMLAATEPFGEGPSNQPTTDLMNPVRVGSLDSEKQSGPSHSDRRISGRTEQMRTIPRQMRRSFDIMDRIGAFASRLGSPFDAFRQLLERQLMLAGRAASWHVRQKQVVGTLADVEFSVFAQWGEDGIIDWLVENVPIEEPTFVEFGVEDYREANTRFLLQNRNWRGLILDANPAHVRAIKRGDIYWRYDVTAAHAHVTPENINDLLRDNGVCGDIGLLSIDIDGNDYWVLEAVAAISPRILVCEYNAVWGDRHAITIPYTENFDRLKAHPSGQYFGASIKAITGLAKSKGYEFVGSSSNGVNAFFVRSDVFESLTDKIRMRYAFPSRHRDSRDERGRLTYVRGVTRADLVKHLPVALVEDENRIVTLASLYPLYSEAWLQQIC